MKYFKTLRHVSILSDHQGALFLAKVILQYSQFNSYLQTRCCGSIPCCVGMCCAAVARCASYDAHLATAAQHIPTQHGMLPQHLVCKYELNCEYCNITLARNKAQVFYVKLYVHSLVDKFKWRLVVFIHLIDLLLPLNTISRFSLNDKLHVHLSVSTDHSHEIYESSEERK